MALLLQWSNRNSIRIFRYLFYKYTDQISCYLLIHLIDDLKILLFTKYFLALTTLTPVNGTVISSSQDKVLNFTIFVLWELVALFEVVMGVPKTICSWYLQIRRYIVPNCGHTIHIKLYRLQRMYMHNKAELTAKM